MHISVIVPCFNEERLLPFFLDYYTSFCDHITIFDGLSTDKSREVVMSYMDRTSCEIELRVVKSPGIIDVFDPSVASLERNPFRSLHYIRSEGWRTLAPRHLDWVFTVDCDEFLWHPLGVRKKLEGYTRQCVSHEARYLGPVSTVVQMMSRTFPSCGPLPSTIRQGWIEPGVAAAKRVAFRPAFNPSHEFAEFDSEFSDEPIRERMFLLHYARLGFEHFVTKSKEKLSRLSEHNLQRNLSFHLGPWSCMMQSHFDALFSCATSIPDVTHPQAGKLAEKLAEASRTPLDQPSRLRDLKTEISVLQAKIRDEANTRPPHSQ